MLILKDSIKFLGSNVFEKRLKAELETLGVDQLPLQQGLSHSNVALDHNIQAVILHSTEESRQLRIKVGLFYSGIIAGCSCADDPSPIDEQNEYCEIEVRIDKASGQNTIILLKD